MIPLQPEIVHFRVALVTDAVERGIILSQLTVLVTACLANGFTTALAILFRISVHELDLAREGSLTELAVL